MVTLWNYISMCCCMSISNQLQYMFYSKLFLKYFWTHQKLTKKHSETKKLNISFCNFMSVHSLHLVYLFCSSNAMTLTWFRFNRLFQKVIHFQVKNFSYTIAFFHCQTYIMQNKLSIPVFKNWVYGQNTLMDLNKCNCINHSSKLPLINELPLTFLVMCQ